MSVKVLIKTIKVDEKLVLLHFCMRKIHQLVYFSWHVHLNFVEDFGYTYIHRQSSVDSTFSSLISRTWVVNCTNYFLQIVKATLLANWTISVGGPSMGRFRKGRIGKQKKKRLVPVTVHETRMGKEQHTAYVQLLEDVLGTEAGNRQSHSRAPPPRIMSLSSLRHPGRKIAKINKNLTEAFNAANNAVFKNHGIHPGDPPTVNHPQSAS